MPLAFPSFWRETVSDDYALSDAVHRAGLRIVFAPGAMAVSTGRTGAGEFLAWARRQLTITRVYRPRLWSTALLAHIFYCGGMAAAIVASIHGSRGAEWVLLAQLSPGMLKGANRATLAKAELPAYQSWFDRHAWVHTLWVPLVHLDLVDRTARLGIRQSHRVARQPLSLEGRASTRLTLAVSSALRKFSADSTGTRVHSDRVG